MISIKDPLSPLRVDGLFLLLGCIVQSLVRDAMWCPVLDAVVHIYYGGFTTSPPAYETDVYHDNFLVGNPVIFWQSERFVYSPSDVIYRVTWFELTNCYSFNDWVFVLLFYPSDSSLMSFFFSWQFFGSILSWCSGSVVGLRHSFLVFLKIIYYYIFIKFFFIFFIMFISCFYLFFSSVYYFNLIY